MKILGKWRIIEASMWDQDYLDLCEPAFILFDPNGESEMAYGAMNACLDIAPRDDSVDFEWTGSDEGDEVSGDGWAELQPDGSIQGEITYKYGDETTFKAVPWPTSSTPC